MKFKLTSNTITKFGKKLYQIKALISFGQIKKGDLGGYVKKDSNLDQFGNAWVSGNAWVYGDARVYGDAWVYGDARVSGNARVYGDAWVYGNARVSGDAWVTQTPICISGTGRHITITESHVIIGCEIFTHNEFTFLTQSKANALGVREQYRNYYDVVLAIMDAKFPLKDK